jgi:hypothetical protein
MYLNSVDDASVFLFDVFLQDLSDGQVGDPKAESSGNHSGQKNADWENKQIDY